MVDTNNVDLGRAFVVIRKGVTIITVSVVHEVGGGVREDGMEDDPTRISLTHLPDDRLVLIMSASFELDANHDNEIIC